MDRARLTRNGFGFFADSFRSDRLPIRVATELQPQAGSAWGRNSPTPTRKPVSGTGPANRSCSPSGPDYGWTEGFSPQSCHRGLSQEPSAGEEQGARSFPGQRETHIVNREDRSSGRHPVVAAIAQGTIAHGLIASEIKPCGAMPIRLPWVPFSTTAFQRKRDLIRRRTDGRSGSIYVVERL